MATNGWLHRLTRRKVVDLSPSSSTQLARCLTAVDLVALGIGCTLGAGIYAVAGQVARQIAGPSVILSFLVAAVASMLAGLCYAEFGARVPKAGSAYIYSYVTLGELCAFIIGWNLLLEFVIGTSSVARAWTSYVDSLFGNKISNFFLDKTPMDIPSFASFPDFFALGIILVLTVILLIGAKESTILNNAFTVVNVLVVIYMFICGLFKVDFKNWTIPQEQIQDPSTDGSGGFFPFGVSGMFSGAATCFYAFVGFDVIATTGEEAKNPQRDIPLGIIVSLTTCAVAYCGIASVLTLMIPYYDIDMGAPLPDAFGQVGWGVAQYAIAVGAVCGLTTSLLGGMFPMPRVAYSMADDGLLFKCFAYISPRFKTPAVSTVVTGLVAGVMAMLLDVKELVDLMSIATLLAYTLVAACVIILRYDIPYTTDGNFEANDIPVNKSDFCCFLIKPRSIAPTSCSAAVVKVCVLLFGILCIIIASLQRELSDKISEGDWFVISVISGCAILMLLIVVVVARQPQSSDAMAFKVPLLPWIPAISMFVNIYLMLQLSSTTWLRFAIWMVLGLVIYFTYGMWNSKEEKKNAGGEYEAIPGDTLENTPISTDVVSFNKEDSF